MDRTMLPYGAQKGCQNFRGVRHLFLRGITPLTTVQTTRHAVHAVQRRSRWVRWIIKQKPGVRMQWTPESI